MRCAQVILLHIFFKLNIQIFIFFSVCPDKGQKAQFSWYPAIISFERSEKNQGRWTENLDAEFEIADKGNQSNSHRPGTNSDTGLERPPLSMRKWKNSLKNGGDTINAMHHLNAKALEVIKKWGTK
jgi:hypothetical protein